MYVVEYPGPDPDSLQPFLSSCTSVTDAHGRGDQARCRSGPRVRAPGCLLACFAGLCDHADYVVQTVTKAIYCLREEKGAAVGDDRGEGRGGDACDC